MENLRLSAGATAPEARHSMVEQSGGLRALSPATQVLLFAPLLACSLIFSGLAALLLGVGTDLIAAALGMAGTIGFLAVASLGAVGRQTLGVIAAGAAYALVTVAAVVIADGGPANVDWGVTAKIVAQIVLVVGWTAFAMAAPWDRRGFWMALLLITGSITLLNTLEWVRSGFVIPFDGFGDKKNNFGAFCSFSVFVSLRCMVTSPRGMGRLLAAGALSLAFLMLFASANRSMIVLLAGGLFVSWTSPSWTKSRLLSVGLIALLVVAVAVIPYLYTLLESPYLSWVYDWSLENFDMRVDSGRDDIWPAVRREIAASPLYGCGSHRLDRFYITRGDGFEKVLSFHNFYLDVLHRSGLLGFAGFVVLLAAVCDAYRRSKASPLTQYAVGFVFAILLRESFEVSLTHNNLQIGFGAWTIIACGMSDAARREAAAVADADDEPLTEAAGVATPIRASP